MISHIVRQVYNGRRYTGCEMASSHRSRSPERRRAVEGVDGASAVSRRGQPRPAPVTASSTPVASEAYIEVDLDAVEDERELSAVGRRAQLLPEPVWVAFKPRLFRLFCF